MDHAEDRLAVLGRHALGDGLMGKSLDLRLQGRGFDSRSPYFSKLSHQAAHQLHLSGSSQQAKFLSCLQVRRDSNAEPPVLEFGPEYI